MNLEEPPIPDDEPEDIFNPEDTFNDHFDIQRGDDIESLVSELSSSEDYSLLPEILQHELDDYIEKKKLNHASAEVLTDMITEHMSCFLILGYDYEGNAVTIQNSNTQKDVDSLNTLIHKYIFTHASNMGNH